MTWFAVGAAAIGAVGSVASSQSSARGQQRAADAAAALQREQFDISRNDQAPWREAGSNALANLVKLSGQYGQAPTSADVMGQPGYQFGLNQGLDALEGRAAAGGGLYSGAAGKALTRYGNDYATTKYADAFNQRRLSEGDIWNRYAGLAGIGQAATNQLGAQGQAYANNVGSIGMSNANAQGAASIAQGNAWGNALNQGASWWNQRQQPAPSPTWSRPGGYGGYGSGQMGSTTINPQLEGEFGWADGGPVPRVGTRAPVRQGGTGGGMSANTLLMMLLEAQAAQQPMQPMMGSIDPRIAMANRLRAVGEYSGGGDVEGPGGPRDDMIPARLSNGEHVMDAASVNAMGEGDNDRGQMQMNKLRALLKGL